MHLKRMLQQIAHTTMLRNVLLGLVSPNFRSNHRLARRLAHEIIEAGFENISSRRDYYPEAGRKYLNLGMHLEGAVREARALSLLESSGLRVLDIGCGTAYFLYVLRSRGHDVVGLDLDDNAMYNDVVRLLALPRVTHRIERFKPLPDLGKSFDLITAFSVCFDCHGTDKVWGASEWKYFIGDCLSRLRHGGRVFLRFNPATTHDFDFIPGHVAEMLRRIPGGYLSSNKEEFLLNYIEPITI